MENFQNTEREKWIPMFVKVSFVQNGQKSIRVQCKRCTICTANDDFSMWKHWKYYCPRNFLFEYVYPKNRDEKIAIRCVVCCTKFDTVTLNFMTSHRDSCTPPQSVSSRHNLDHNSEPAVSKKPLQTTNNNPQTASKTTDTCLAEKTSGNLAGESRFSVDLNSLQFKKRIVYTLLRVGDKQVKEIAECQICKRIFIIDHMKLLQHRAQCRRNEAMITEPVHEFLENEPEVVNLISDPELEQESEMESEMESIQENESEVLISVQTVSQPVNIINSENITSNEPTNQQIACFICNRSSNEPWADIYFTVSDSGIPIYDFIWNFLGSKPSVRNNGTDANDLKNHVICKECLCSINQYDKARSTAKRFKKDLRQKLAETEMYFEQLENQIDEQENVEHDQDKQNRGTSTASNESPETLNVIDLCEDD